MSFGRAARWTSGIVGRSCARPGGLRKFNGGALHDVRTARELRHACRRLTADRTAASATRLIWASNVASRRLAWRAMRWCGILFAGVRHACPPGGGEAARGLRRVANPAPYCDLVEVDAYQDRRGAFTGVSKGMKRASVGVRGDAAVSHSRGEAAPIAMRGQCRPGMG